MGKKLSLADRLQIAAELSRRAQFFHAAWSAFALADSREAHAPAFNEHAEALVMTQAANMVALVCTLHSLFERRNDTVNLPSISDELSGMAGRLISDADSIVKKVLILRHKLYAHRNGSLTQADVYRLAKINSNDLRWLAIRSAAIVRAFCDHLGLPIPQDADEAQPLMREMLEALARDARSAAR